MSNLVDLGKRVPCPIDLFAATVHKKELTASPRFIKVLSRGQILNSSGVHMMYTKPIKDSLEARGYGFYENNDMIAVICYKPSDSAIQEFNNLVRTFKASTLRKLDSLQEL